MSTALWNSPAGGSASPGRHEDLAHAGGEQAAGELLQVLAVAHEPGGEVRHDGVAVGGRRSAPSTVESSPLAGDAVTVDAGGDGHVRDDLLYDSARAGRTS